MTFVRSTREMVHATAVSAKRCIKFAYQKFDTFLRSEDGDMTAEATLMVTGLVVNALWPNPVLAAALELALYVLSKLKNTS